MTVSTDSPSPLSLTLFGPLEVISEGTPIPPVRSRKILWLLALLTLRHGRPVEREWLAGILWPDADQSQGFSNLRPVLSQLRVSLGQQAFRLSSPNRHTIQLDLAGAVVDVLTFDTAIASKSSEALEQAVALYRGPLLEGCSEDWVFQERDARKQACLEALQRLAELASLAGNFADAATYLRRAVEVDPVSDSAHRALMEVLTKGGDRNAALELYREFSERLRRELVATPHTDTIALYQRLRQEAREGVRSVPATSRDIPQKVAGYLPHSLTPLIGREEEKEEVSSLLRRSRLVTLTGLGGIGKTRLAVEVARTVTGDYPDGTWLLSLESLSLENQIIHQIAALFGVRGEVEKSLLDRVTNHLRQKRLLLVLDNCEHLLEESERLTTHLLRECVGLRLLTTSREPLRGTGESVWPVPSLPYPNTDHLPENRVTLREVLVGYDSVRLFVERAQSARPSFSLTPNNARTVAWICAQLEGIPLAIELSAARISAMTVEQIAERLQDHLSLLVGRGRSSQARQQTLRSAIDWSYELLTVAERTLLHRLSVFAGGWTQEAAQAVGGEKDQDVIPLLESLVEKSLVSFEAYEEIGSGRYRLSEVVRQYAVEKLRGSGELAHIQQRHQDWFVAFADEVEPKLRGTSQTIWLQRVEMEYDNLRRVMIHGQPEASLRLAGAIWWYWKIRGRYDEGRHILKTLLEKIETQKETVARAKALNALGALALNQGEFQISQRLHEEAIAIFRQQEYRLGIATTLNNLGHLAIDRGDSLQARLLFEESLSVYREIDDKLGIATVLGNLGVDARRRGDYALTRTLYEESLEIRRSLGDIQGTAMILSNLGNVARLQGDYDIARRLLEEALAIRRGQKDPQGIAYTLSQLGSLATVQGDTVVACELHEESLSIRRELGEKRSIAWSLNNLGSTILLAGKAVAAQRFLEESQSLFREIGDRSGLSWATHMLGDVAHKTGSEATAREFFDEGLRLFREIGDTEGVAESLYDIAALSIPQADGVAARLWGAAEVLRESIGSPIPPAEQDRYRSLLEKARASCDADTFDTAWQEGRTLTWQQAVADALGE